MMISQQTSTSNWVKITFVRRLVLFLFVFMQSWKTLDQVVEYIIEHIHVHRLVIE